MKNKANFNNIIDIGETAEMLGISVASVRNWVLHNYLAPVENNTKLNFVRSDVITLKDQLEKGKINRLQQRANKSNAIRTFLPKEYFHNKSEEENINNILVYVSENNLELNSVLFFLSLNYLKSKDLLNYQIASHKIKFNDTLNKFFFNELNDWYYSLDKNLFDEKYFRLLEFHIPEGSDVLGTIYQTLSKEGKKAKNGSYYTPDYLVKSIIEDYYKPNAKFLDPCCGTGQFVLQYAQISNDPLSVTGFDTDKIAVKIARLNLLTMFKDIDFSPRIYNKDTLFLVERVNLIKKQKLVENFDFIATNPPWGLHLTKNDFDYLQKQFPEIKSLESFSYFLTAGLELLNPDGKMSFLLPEAILHVRMHSDIREYLLRNCSILKIEFLGHFFKNVFSNVIRMDIEKKIKGNHIIQILKGSTGHTIQQKRLIKTKQYAFEVFINDEDNAIFNKVYGKNHVTLKNNSDWALGIITGNNEKYISAFYEEGLEKIYKGKDISKFIIGEPSSYIKFEPEKFQQVAPIHLYRTDEKLIYRFISKYLVFAYDNKQRLTLNSANILIPRIMDYPIKVIAAFFNSTLYQFIYQKKFNSIKILRSHIEELPLPTLNTKVHKEIINLVDQICTSNGNLFPVLDRYIMHLFDLNIKEINYIDSYINKSRGVESKLKRMKSKYNMYAKKPLNLPITKFLLKNH